MVSLNSSKAIKAAARAALAGLAVAASLDPAAALPMRKSHATMVLDAIDGFIVPHIDKLAKSSARLSSAVDRVCAEAGAAEARNSAQTAFAETVRAWAALDFVRFGPVAREHRLERVFFWPDPRGFASRQLNGLLAAKKPDLLLPGALAKQSVAVQGLTALEILLFDDKTKLGAGIEEAARYRCDLARAIAENIEGVTAEIGTGWSGADGYRMKMLTPGSDNALYRDASETVREIAKALGMGLDLARDRFIMPELTAVSANPPRRVRLAFESAKLTGAYLDATVTSLKELFDVMGLASFVPHDKPWMAQFVPNAWKSILADVKKLDALRADARGSEAHLHALRKMRFDLSALRQIIFKELAPNADIEMGINELDGD